jgi:murein DD-endopeptidase MepM/ murein hydrolase activator NlpD
LAAGDCDSFESEGQARRLYWEEGRTGAALGRGKRPRSFGGLWNAHNLARGTAILNHGDTRRPHRSRALPDPIDLGNAPPLSADGGSAALVDRRRVSVQWFSATVLTGLCGAALMGGAVYASLDGEATFAAVPEHLEATLKSAIGAVNERLSTSPHKSDKLPMAGEINVSRQVTRVSTTVHVGDHEVVRVRPYIRVASNLSLAMTELSANIPPFNPQRLLARSSGASTAETEGPPDAEPDAEVSFVTRDLAGFLPKAKIVSTVPLEAVVAQVRDVAEWAGTGTIRPPVTAGSALSYAPAGHLDPYAGFEARIVPENITLLAKTAPLPAGASALNERTIIAKKGESVGSILRDLGATPEEIKAIVTLLGPRGRDAGIKEGQKLRILLGPTDTPRLQPVRVMLITDTSIEATVALSDAGKYVAVDIQHVDNDVLEADEESEDGTVVRLYQSIYETALRNQVPRPIIDEIIRIYSYDVDFQRRVQPGDAFELLYAGDEEADTKGDVLVTTLTLGGETKKYYRYQTPDDNVLDYYDETGKSAKKFLVRKPVLAGTMRSGFGVRRHPILGYMKMHTGVDWAAPNGTPIYASGNGQVEKAGWEAGYGKYVRLRHANGYETAYGHMSGFARGIQPGVHVHQGQIIGYVGSTGLSTGPHCHYEILVNSRLVDPMRIKLPRGRALEGTLLTSFERERDRVEAVLARSNGRVAQQSPATRSR